jgi:plastocyanin domain-containing protein
MVAGAWIVTVVGTLLVVGVCIYFLAPRGAAVRAATGAGGVQEVRIQVASGYDPSLIELAAGRPARLVFNRKETEGCSETLLIPEWKITRRLPAHEDTVIELAPHAAGDYEFTCGMHMLRGTIRVR